MYSETTQRRVSRLRDAFDQKEIDGVVIGCLENRRYLSGFTGSDGYLLISRSAALLATDFRYFEQARRESAEFDLLPLKNYKAAWLADIVLKLGLKRVGFEAARLSYSSYRDFVDALASAPSAVALVPTVGLAESLRATKDTEEVSQISTAARLAHRALGVVSGELRAGMTEREFAWRLERCLRESGSEAVPFEIIVASGPNAALPHARASERCILAGEPVVIDFGARIDGYCCDVTRTLWIGDADPKLLRIYDTVLGAQRTAMELIRTGMTGSEADRLARAVIEEGGYGEAFGHGLGHGVGLEVHESPRVGISSQDTLVDGMVLTIEPGIYVEGWGGVRIEDTAVMESGRARVLC